MGLRFPEDLAAWRRWQSSRHRLRRLRSALRPGRNDGPELVLEAPETPRVLVALDSWSPTSGLALRKPLAHLSPGDVAVLRPPGETVIPGHHQRQITRPDQVPEELSGLRAAMAIGHYLGHGATAQTWAQQLEIPFVVVQHGLLTPLMAPLPPGAHLMAWTEEDAAFWAEGRSDVTSETVGSQLLWAATRRPATPGQDRPVFLGQLHGAELPRAGLVRATEEYCRGTGATYRPHPSEKDRLSRWQHTRWERSGITIERDGPPLAELDRPVASVFSTGVLEAAARGLPAWVHHPDPPGWLVEFWERYGMSRWGRDPRPSQPRGIPAEEPARRIAARIQELVV